MPRASENETLYTPLIRQARLALAFNPPYNELLDDPRPSASTTMKMEDRLVSSAGVDIVDIAPLRFSSLSSGMRFRHMRFILNRGAFVKRALQGLPLSRLAGQLDTNPELESSIRCLDCAGEIIRSIEAFTSHQHSSLTPIQSWYCLSVIPPRTRLFVGHD